MADRGRGRGARGGGDRGGRGGGDRGGRGGRGRGRGDLPFHPRGGSQGQSDRGRGGVNNRGGDRGGGGGGGGYRGGGGGGRGGSAMRGGDAGDPPPERVQPELFNNQGQPAVIDAAVQKIEDAVVKSTKAYLAGKAQDLDPSNPPRPSYGTKGQPVTLWANYFRMDVPASMNIHRYSVDIQRRSDKGGEANIGPKRKKELVKLLLDEVLASYKAVIATDFAANLVSSQELPKELGEWQGSLVYRMPGADPIDATDAKAKVYMIRIEAQGALPLSQLLSYLNQTQVQEWRDEQQELIRSLNIIMGHFPKDTSSVATIGANKHYDTRSAPYDRFNVGSGVQAIRGYFVSVRPSTGRVLFNIQVKNGAFYQPVRLDQLIRQFARQPAQHIVSLAKFLKRLNVHATHIQNKNSAGELIPSIRTIVDVAKPQDGAQSSKDIGPKRTPPKVKKFGAGPTDVSFFMKTNKDGPDDKDEKWITVSQYFKNEFNIQSDPGLPVVNVGSAKQPVYLIAEACMVLPGQQVRAKLDPAQTKKMIDFAVRYPHQNARSIVDAGAQLVGLRQGAVNAKMASFKVDVQPRMIAVSGRVLPTPSLTYGSKKTTTPRFGAWNLISTKFHDARRLDAWSYIRIRWVTDHAKLTTTEQIAPEMDAFRQILNASGVATRECTPGVVLNVAESDYAQQIDDIMRRMATNRDRNIGFVIVILPERNNTQLYNQVKISCDINHGLLNACVQDGKFMKRSTDTYANIALKVNLKLGGGNHVVDPAKLGIIKEGKTMVVGLDVTHPSPGSKDNAPSVAAIVASVGMSLSQFPAAIALLPSRQEMIKEGMKDLFKSRLSLWQKSNNGALPQNIIIYRDGVSEGQYDLVLNTELPEIRKACSEMYKPDQTKAGLPKISIVVVGKRHHTRFYVADRNKMDRSGNPGNGTVVDRGVTQAWLWDFFLQAHTAIKGTARPAHYYVIYDQIFRARQTDKALAADALEEITHSMCYMFGRATKAVSICPPAYYADLVAERARCYLHQLFDPSASDTASTTSDSQQAAGAVSQTLVNLHARIVNSMFYT